MTDAELNALLLELQRTTPLSRLNLDEARAVFDRLKELGHPLTASKGIAAGAAEGIHSNYRAKANG